MVRRIGKTALGACALVLAAGMSAQAAVSAGEAAKLKSTLTPLGAERAGNADGSIPIWDGGYKGAAGAPGAPRPDPFAFEKPVFSITAHNAAQYAGKLPEGVMTLLKRYPDSFRADVYPTHRTANAPQWVYDNTAQNAVRAKLVSGGNSLTGAYGGIPFPIPQSGNEAMWNALLYWRGSSVEDSGLSYVGASNGSLVFTSRTTGYDEFPYYDPKGTLADFSGVYQTKYILITDPAYQNGNATLSHFTIDPVRFGTPSWQYLPGQRRVRKSPNLLYDMPNFFQSGLGQFDQAFGFNGPLDEYTWKLSGKQEMYIPYNANRFWTASVTEQMLPKRHANPDLMRWELHRVWVVDASLAPGRRNVVSRRRMYIDEDTWMIVGVDCWDSSGSYWQFVQQLPILMPDLPAVAGVTFPLYDFKRNEWTLGDDVDASVRVQYKPVEMHPDSFTPDNLAASGVR